MNILDNILYYLIHPDFEQPQLIWGIYQDKDTFVLWLDRSERNFAFSGKVVANSETVMTVRRDNFDYELEIGYIDEKMFNKMKNHPVFENRTWDDVKKGLFDYGIG